MAHNTTKDFFINIPITVLLLLLLVCTTVITRYILMKKKSRSLRLTRCPELLFSPLGCESGAGRRQCRDEGEGGAGHRLCLKEVLVQSSGLSNESYLDSQPTGSPVCFAFWAHRLSSPVTPLSGWLSLLQCRSNFIFSVRVLESPVRSGKPSKVCVLTLPSLSPTLPLHPLGFPCYVPALFTCSFVQSQHQDVSSSPRFRPLTPSPRVYYRTDHRYQLKGQLLQGDVSLTIENATERDSGLYCCRVEKKGWNGVQRLTASLQVQPGCGHKEKCFSSSACPVGTSGKFMKAPILKSSQFPLQCGIIFIETLNHSKPHDSKETFTYNCYKETLNYHKTHNYYKETLSYHKTYNYYKKTLNYHKTHNYYKETLNYHKTHNYYKETLTYHKTHNYYKETLNYHKTHNYYKETLNYHKTHNYYKETLTYHKTHNYYKETLNYHKTHNYYKETLTYNKTHNCYKETLNYHKTHNYYKETLTYHKSHNYYKETHKCSKINQSLYFYSSTTNKHADFKTR
ncbi:hypothetical protein ACRRTK_006621 [Alexandromys fortis]